VILYSASCHVLKIEKFDFAISAKNYYNTVHKMVSDKDKLKIINDLFMML